MANVVVAIYNPLIRQNGMYPYFENFLENLKACGNNVLCFQKLFLELKTKQTIPIEYYNKIIEFKPDLFILFDNQFWDISNNFEQPIIIFDIDSPNCFCNIDNLKINKYRYKYLTIQKSAIQLIKDVLGTNKIEVQYVPPCTAVKAEPMPLKNNIGFCGSHWLWNDFKQIENFLSKNPTYEEKEFAQIVYKKFLKYPYLCSEEIYKELGIQAKNKLEFKDLAQFAARISGLKRLRYLQEIVDLGLEVRGYLWNCPNSTFVKAFPEVLLCYNSEIINNIITTQNFYNSVKIGFNVNHIQASSGFSWRVCDILASNACLVTEKTEDLKAFGIKIPQFENMQEARELCQKLLKNENMRTDIVEAAHEIIEKNYRFNHVLSALEYTSGIKLQFDNIGSLEIIRTDEQKPQDKKPFSKPNFPNINKKELNFKNKMMYKISKHFYKKIK